MKAMILSAGLGTRLRPITYNIPKPLIPVLGRPIISYVINLLKRYGFRDLIINLYHLPQSIVDYLGDGSSLGVKITYSWEKELLGTAGAILEVESLLAQETFLVINSDILVELDLKDLLEFHYRRKAATTLVVKVSKEAQNFGAIGLDKKSRVVSIVKLAVEDPYIEGIFTGISVMEPAIFKYISAGGDGLGDDVFPKMLLGGENLYGYTKVNYWLDIGTPKRLAQAEEDIKKGRIGIEP